MMSSLLGVVSRTGSLFFVIRSGVAVFYVGVRHYRQTDHLFNRFIYRELLKILKHIVT